MYTEHSLAITHILYCLTCFHPASLTCSVHLSLPQRSCPCGRALWVKHRTAALVRGGVCPLLRRSINPRLHRAGWGAGLPFKRWLVRQWAGGGGSGGLPGGGDAEPCVVGKLTVLEQDASQSHIISAPRKNVVVERMCNPPPEGATTGGPQGVSPTSSDGALISRCRAHSMEFSDRQTELLFRSQLHLSRVRSDQFFAAFQVRAIAAPPV